MKKLNFKAQKNQKGITLIALVITIIVLLILAVVSIATLTGENGILTRANDAKTETEEAKEDELRKLTALDAATNINGTTHTDNSRNEEVQETVKIPAGFAVSQVEGENTIEDGLVIIDSKGNEFVWVPVDNYSEFTRRAGYKNGSSQTLTSSYGEADSTGNNTNSGVAESETTKKEAQEMYESVERNKGFYIGKYEAGRDSTDNKVVVQKGVDVYNNVTWSRNGQMNEESTEIAEGVDGRKDGAIELARNFDTENNYTTVTSTLCYGVQWDSIMRWMEEIENPNAITTDLTKYIQDSTGMGWYSDNYQNGNPDYKTGIDLNEGRNRIKNIYDLAGNVVEWTMESYSINTRNYRGGSYSGIGINYPVSARGNGTTYFSSESLGFRIALYLNN